MTRPDDATEGRPKTIEVCPAEGCGTINIYPRRPSMAPLTDGHAFRCSMCGHRFDEPAERKRRRSGVCIRGDSLARRLHEADPDEVGP